MDLLLHIGLPKTGTTTLQNHVLNTVSPSLGKSDFLNAHEPEKSLRLTLAALIDGCERRSAHTTARRTRRWVKSVRRLAQAGLPDVGDPPGVLISSEHLSSLRSSRPWPFYSSSQYIEPNVQANDFPPIGAYLRRFLVPAWEDGQVRVLLTIRRPAEWLAAYYAQISNRLWTPSQQDFDAQVEFLLHDPAPLLLFDSLEADLSGAVGRANVHVLPLEQFGTPLFWETLDAFLGPLAQGVARPDLNFNRANQRSSGRGSWKLRAQSNAPIQQTKESLDNRWPHDAAPNARRLTLGALHRLEPSRNKRVPKHAEAEITLRDHTRKRAMERLRPSVKRLEGHTGLDLKRLEYY